LGFENGEKFAVQITQLFVGGRESAFLFRRNLEHVVAEEAAAVAEVEHAQQRRRNIQLAHHLFDALRREVLR
jgi:type VI protein secretion system component VasK